MKAFYINSYYYPNYGNFCYKIVNFDGIYYFKNDTLHRDNNLPAFISHDKQDFVYSKNGCHHREDGAAIIMSEHPDNNEYHLNNKRYGSNNIKDKNYIPSDEYWIKYQKLIAFE